MNPHIASAGRCVLRAVTAPAASRAMLRGLSHAGVLPETVWKRLPVEATFSVALPNGGRFRYRANPGDAVGRALHWRGLHGPDVESLLGFYRLAARARVVLDIGANTGLYSLIACAARAQSMVISFEPVPQIYERLVSNLQLNGFMTRCRPLPVAVSDSIGSARFHVPFADMPTSASLNENGFRGIAGRLIDVPVTSIDAVCSNGEAVDLVKIDVEGFEDKVLAGMHRILAQSRPAVIVECNPDGPIATIESLLGEFGYRFYHLRPGGLQPAGRIVPDRTQRHRNFLSMPAEKTGLLGS